MPRCCCFVTNCRTGYESTRKQNRQENKKNPTCFSAPKDPQILQAWRRAIPRRDRELSTKDSVCELHFEEHFIDRFYSEKVKLPDGTIHQMERERPRLLPGAVPSKFPECPPYLSKKLVKRRSPKKRSAVPAVSERSVVVNHRRKPRSSYPSSSCTSGVQNEPLYPASVPLQSLYNTDVSMSVVAEMRLETEEVEAVPIQNVEPNSHIDLTDADSTNIDPNNPLSSYNSSLSNLVYNSDKKSAEQESDTTNKRYPVTFVDLLISPVDRPRWFKIIESENDVICYQYWKHYLSDDSTVGQNLKMVKVDSRLDVKVVFGSVITTLLKYEHLDSTEDLMELFQLLERTKICPNNLQHTSSTLRKCRGYLLPGEEFCSACKRVNKASQLRRDLFNFKKEHIKKLRASTKKYRQQIDKLQEQLEQRQKECAEADVDNIFPQLPGINDSLKLTISECIKYAKRTHKNGRRYTQKWIYECMLMKIKDARNYRYLREKNILPLPHESTIRRYLRKLKPVYGFQTGLFNLMKQKGEQLTAMEKRGVLLIDEMKLNEILKFDKTKLEFVGFTDLGKHTPDTQQSQLGDHGLVIMYQPFQGKWIQPIGSFLSRGAASADILYQLVIEAVILMENSGFKVDAITTDGATWNRSMWDKFGVSEDNVSTEHFCDEHRRLFMLSDFPHLIKALRNKIVQLGEFKTPVGVVKMSHWKCVLDAENFGNRYGLKIFPQLKDSHLNPQGYEKMNVGLAYQLFHEKVVEAMELYKMESEFKEGLKDVDSTCSFIKVMNKLITSMSSRTPRHALWKVTDARDQCQEEENIREFLKFLEDWKQMFSEDHKKNKTGFLTYSTYVGLKVTLNGTLLLKEYLTEKCGYSYLMTSRLNQDNLEKFFGMIRAAAGCNDHPDSVMFAQIYKLMSAYALLKPPKGSNVSSGEMLTSFLHMMQESHIVGEEKNSVSKEQQWRLLMDHIMEGERDIDESDVQVRECLNDFSETKNAILQYVAGYVARKSDKFTKCELCRKSLRGCRAAQGPLVAMRQYSQNSDGGLISPSEQLLTLLGKIERVILSEIEAVTDVLPDTFFLVTQRLEEDMVSLPRVGCSATSNEQNHSYNLSIAVIHFYLVLRMQFIVREANKQISSRSKSKDIRKRSKL